ncbi:hypothetical protein PHLGIDRAFT_190399 [Phlebiopsis gigantea 11061_1 CR5-6]|uniref:Uncharacterized protein n=1 Tax=Phlebiopsis gigantea (strain 11061_1 CR5-6) TaxID=745531 RepID=A0A0C3S3Q9_PHLG1|nr:hypothetical protein PHLGIDRAFT_190399 [Phlebiopsis gigantea 11061_1 CR5-6]
MALYSAHPTACVAAANSLIIGSVAPWAALGLAIGLCPVVLRAVASPKTTQKR